MVGFEWFSGDEMGLSGDDNLGALNDNLGISCHLSKVWLPVQARHQKVGEKPLLSISTLMQVLY